MLLEQSEVGIQSRKLLHDLDVLQVVFDAGTIVGIQLCQSLSDRIWSCR